MRWAVLFVLAFVAFAAPAPAQVLPPLATSKVVIDTAHGPVTFIVEMAEDTPSQERGLMYRKYLAPGAGMLFDFHAPQPVTFWMKDTFIPLDMLFIRKDGTISSIAANAKPFDRTTIPSKVPVLAVLEINGGRAAEMGIVPGDVVHNAIFGNAK
jgi:uncharacterized protein